MLFTQFLQHTRRCIAGPNVWIIVFLWLLTNPLKGLGQSEQAVFKQISNAPFGFNHLEIKDILKDIDGFIWLASNKGLYRYDGHDMRVFGENPLDSTSIGGNLTRVLAEGPDGSIWVGTHEAGIFRFDKYREVFTHFPADSSNTEHILGSYIQDMLFDSFGRLWVATNKGLGVVDEHTGRVVPYKNKAGSSVDFAQLNVAVLELDPYHHIWLGTKNAGLIRLNLSSGEIHSLRVDEHNANKPANNEITAISSDGKGKLWFGTNGPVFYQLDPQSLRIQKDNFVSQQIGKDAALDIIDIEPDGEGNLWLGLNIGGLVYYSPTKQKLVSYKHDISVRGSIGSNLVQNLMFDEDGILWIGHSGSGLSQLLTSIQFRQILDSKRTEGSQCLLEDRYGNLWIATRKHGIFIYNPETHATTNLRTQAGNPQSLADNMVWDMIEDEEGFIWIATHDGLQKYDPIEKTFETYRERSGLTYTAIKCLQRDYTGRLWIGTFEGLYWMDVKSKEIHLADSTIKELNTVIWDIFEDSQNQLWVAPFGEGLYRLDRESNKWKVFRQMPGDLSSLSHNAVQSITEDSKGQLWIGTKGGGLNLYIPNEEHPERATFKHWRTYNSGLAEDIVYIVSADKHGKLWLSTDMGLFSFHIESEQFSPYFIDPDIRGLVMRSRTPGENLYVGNNEIYCFSPASISQNNRIPPVFITELHIHGQVLRPEHGAESHSTFPRLPQSLIYTSALELDYHQNDITLVFSALNYVQPELNQYRYKLEQAGSEAEWIEADASSRRARYTNLRPGKYTFHVQGSNHDGVWNTLGRSFSFVIHPPIWRTWWAYVGYIMLILCMLAGIRQYELRRYKIREEAKRLKELDEVKTRFYTNITHEFRTPLTIILGMADQLKNRVNGNHEESLDMINRNGHQLLKLVNQMLDLSKLESGGLKLHWEQGDIISYLQYVIEAFESWAASKQIHIHFLPEEKALFMDYDPDRLLYIMSNLLSNAIKYSAEGKDVYVLLRKDHMRNSALPHLLITVKDQGSGIPQSQIPHIFDRFYQLDDETNRNVDGTGIGLTFTRELARLMGGDIDVSSQWGVGSEFRIWLPIRCEHEIRSSIPEMQGISAPDPVAPAEQAESGKPHLLIVEDNPDLVRYLITSLEKTYQLEVAHNGQEGINQAIASIPDMIITDVMMPEKDGFELCKILKNHELTSHIPIIMLTAKADVESRLDGLRTGADAYMAKPFMKDELAVRIQALLNQRKKLQAWYLSQVGINKARVETGAKTLDDVVPDENGFLNKVNKKIDEKLDDHTFGVDELSKSLNMSTSSLFRKIKALTDFSTAHYLRSYRLAKAKVLLKTTPHAISEIAYKTGFSDPRYFSRVFKNEVGKTPTRYRQEES